MENCTKSSIDRKKTDYFLHLIHRSEIKPYDYFLCGSEEGYQRVPIENKGYLPFYQAEKPNVKDDPLPDGSPLKAGEKREKTKYIVIHNTGMAHPTATAAGLNRYIHTTDRIASWHFSVDEREAYRELALDEVGWHAGDSYHRYGETYCNKTYHRHCIGGGNTDGIGIEMCVYAGCDFNSVMRNTAKLTAWLLKKYNLTPASVRQHFDFSGKNCPEVIRRAYRWGEMLDLIYIEYYAATRLSGYHFKWKSLDPDILGDDGRILKICDTDRDVTYRVTISKDGKEETREFKTTIKAKNKGGRKKKNDDCKR